MKTESSTHMEWCSEDYSVRIQHCEYRNDAGEICDEYLGVNYPSRYCHVHRPNNISKGSESS